MNAEGGNPICFGNPWFAPVEDRRKALKGISRSEMTVEEGLTRLIR